ncbi:hypothetical protein SARC_10401 [Sphaeroforma arctica JP610]|uniref:Inositol polyphosphate-related phosphatase domain-containing protein n=1 Tax=Sphaeroforma arctica JP610 TaxID=667725 RepID=A0A0L0FKZ5_9EUKA|nr:hypothetical protein SARC_10401 [Sphaeroforma arctica JP610]KNC77131.1 hypothetical protein SARC_10401 [Sphaeroforma arctica JP610]|eukprot:XP_014151033.1 hypothetical protein SARC_10401 [Sphaeroforma arctica JP610]
MLVERDADVRTRMNGNAVRDLVIHIATWNLGNARPPDDLEAWAAPDKGCDIIAVGVQESVYEDDKEQLLTKLTVACGDRYVFLSRTGMFSSASHKIPKKGRQYADNIKLFIFISREHIGHIVKLTKDSVPTGIGVDYGLGHNKGGVGISFGLYGKRYCFINSHLWCDRILWRVRPGCQVRCEEYSSVPSISTSDHTPVFGRYVALGSSHVPRATGLTPLRLHISNLSVEFTHSLPDEEADDKTTEDGDMIWSDIDLKGGAARQGWVVLLGNDRIKDLIVLAKDLSKPQHGEVDLWYANEKELRTATVELVVMSVHKGKEGKDNKAKRKYSLGECSIPLQDVGMKEMRYDLWRSGVVVGFLRAVFSVVTLYSETKRRPSRVKDETHDAYISPAVETRTLSGLLEVARVDSGGYFSDSGGIGTERPSMTNRSKSSLSQPDLALESTPPDSGRVSPRSKKKSILHKLKPTTPSGSSKRKSLNVKRSSATAPVRPFSVHSDFRFTPDERESAMDFTRSLAQVGRVCTCGNMSDCLKCKATGSKALRDSLKSCKDKILSNFKVELDGTSRRRIAVDNKDKLMREILREEAIIYNSTHSQHTGTQHSSTSSLTADSNGREVSKAPVHALSPITSPEVQGKGTPGDTDRGRQYVRMLSTEVPAKRGKDHKGKKKRNRDRSASDGSHKKFDPAMLVLPLTSLSRPKSPKGKRSPLISSQSMQNTTTHTIHTTPNYTAHQHTHADTYDHTSRQAQLAASTSDDLRVVMPTYEPFYSQPSPPVSSRKSRTRLKKIGSDGHSDSEVIDSKVTASTRSSLLDRMKPTRKRSISKQETQRDKEESASLLVNCDSPVGLRNVLCEPFMLGMDSANSAPASVGSSAVGSPNALTPTGSGGSQSNGDHGGSSRRSGGKDKHKSGHRTSVTNKVNRIFGRKSSDLQVTDIPPQDTSSRAGSHTKPSVQSVVLNKLRSISPRQSNVDVWAAPLLSDDLNDRDREMPRRNSATKVITPHSTNALPSTASSPGIILDSSAQAHAHERRRSTSSDVHGMTQNTTYHPNDSPPSQANAPTDDMQHHTSAEALTFDDLQSAGHSSEHKRYSSIVADLNSPTVSEAGGPSNSSTGGTDGDRNKILQKFKRHTKGDKDKDAKECKPVKEFRDGKLGRDHKDHNGSKRDKKDRRDKRCDKSVERTKDMQVQLSSSNWNYPSVDEI